MRIENDLYSVEIEKTHGLILQITDKKRRLDLVAEPRLAENFRLLLPLPDQDANYILGKDQKLTSFKKTRDGATLCWSGPLCNARGKYNLSVTMHIEFVDQRVQFRLEVRNSTKQTLSEAWYPILGGMMGLGNKAQRKSTKVLLPSGYSQWTSDLFVEFGRGCDLGTPIPEHTFCYPARMPMPWASFYNPKLKCGLYVASYDDAARARLFRLAMSPGRAGSRVDGDWPDSKELKDEPAGVAMNWTHLPYTRPGELFVGSSVALQFHEGDWREAAAIYRRWFEEQYPVVDSRESWLRKETATQDTMFLLPEGNVNVTFAEIPRWAQDAKDYGLKALLISGWNVGGHDRGYPEYEPDPRLGTWKELEAGMAACRKMGMKVYFFVNTNPVDISTEWYRKEGHRYASMDRSGCILGVCGFGMGTLAARMGLTQPPLSPASLGVPAYMELLLRHMKRLAEAGADGVHIDKLMPPTLNFNPLVKTSPDRAEWDAHLKFLDEMFAQCRAINPQFEISYEGWWDRWMSYSDVVWWAPHTHSVIKTVFPQWTPHVGINQPYDYNSVNFAVVRAQNLLVGPANYTESMRYAPMRDLFAYIGEVTRIRNELLDFISRGELLDASEPLFAARKRELRITGPAAKDPNLRWSVFRNIQSGKRAAVLANFGRKPMKALRAALDKASGRTCSIHQPFSGQKTQKFPATVSLPPERFVVIVED